MKPSWKRSLRLLFTSLLLPAVIACGGGAGAPAASPAAPAAGDAKAGGAPAKQAPAAQPSGQVIELTYASYVTESNA